MRNIWTAVTYKTKDLLGLNHRFSFRRSYSQLGEDLIVESIFRRLNQYKISYLDLGCNHPYRFSNSALFYSKGHSGFCVDANPKLIKHFKKSRPRDKTFALGLAETKGVLDFYVMKNSTISTFSTSEYKFYLQKGYLLAKMIQVPVCTLEDFIQSYCGGIFPDFLSLDVEGLDLEILRSYSWNQSKPKVICVETSGFEKEGTNPINSEVANYLNSVGYQLHAFTSLNSIFILKGLFT